MVLISEKLNKNILSKIVQFLYFLCPIIKIFEFFFLIEIKEIPIFLYSNLS